MTRTYLLIAALLSSPAQLNVPEVTPETFSTPTGTNSSVVNSGVTEPNLTKFLRVVQK